MSQSVARTTPARSGDIAVSDERLSSNSVRQRSTQSGRRRWLILAAVVLVAAVAIGANIRPLTHYHDAQARLQDATAKVDSLEAQKDDLQAHLAKLSETGYLETLAREQLTFVRPGEELYIVTDGTGAVASGQPGVEDAASSGSAVDGAGAAVGRQEANESPGFLEKIISTIRGVF